MHEAAAAAGLIGRREELADLRAALADARRGQGGICFISGDPGIGKTTLAEALVGEVATTEIPAYWGRCWESGPAQAYWPWVQVLRACVGDAPSDALERLLGAGAPDVARLLPELAGRVSGLEPSAPLDSPQGRRRLFDSVRQFLASVAADHGGLVVALDDVHAADEASLQLLKAVVHHLSTARLLIVATYREAEMRAQPDRQRLVDAMGPHAQHVRLTGLDRAGVAALLERAGRQVPTPELAAEVHRVTEGSPFFVGEVARLLATEGVGRGVRLPEEVHALIRRRLEPLSQPVRGVLAHAAVLGQQVDVGVLGQIVPGGPEAVLDSLSTGSRLGVIDEVALGRWAFAHSLLREALYDGLAPSERVSLHLQAAEALEAKGATEADLAHHLSAAGSPSAAAYCTKAAEVAMESLAYEDAASWYRRALDGFDGNARDRFDLLMSRAEAEWRSSGFGRANETYGEAFRVARSLRAGDLMGRAALGFRPFQPAVLEESLSALPTDDLLVRPRVLVQLAFAQINSDLEHHDRWVDAAHEAIDAARRSGNAETLANTLLFGHRTLAFEPDHLPVRIALSAEMLDVATRAGRVEDAFMARALHIGDLFEAGDISAVRRHLEMLTEDARRSRLQYYEFTVAFMRAAVAMLEGRVDVAYQLAQRALAIAEAAEAGEGENVFACQLSEIRRQQGRFEELESILRKLEQQWPNEITIPYTIALVLADLGRVDAARTELQRAIAARDPAALPTSEAPVVWTYLADTARLLGDDELARRVYELLRPHAGRHLTGPAVACAYYGCTDRALGVLATLLGRWKEAEQHFEAAHRLHGAAGAEGWLAHGRVDHARMLLARNEPGDAAAATALLQDARAGFRRAGMTVYERRADDLLASTERIGDAAVLAREGDSWVIEYGGRSVRLHDSKGLQHLAQLLGSPGHPLTAADEQGRHRLTRSLRSAIERIAEVHPSLGDHLRLSVRIGMSSTYLPDARTRTAWTVRPD